MTKLVWGNYFIQCACSSPQPSGRVLGPREYHCDPTPYTCTYADARSVFW